MLRAVSLVSGLLALGGSMPAQVEPHAGQWHTWVIASGYGTRLRRSGLTAASKGVNEDPESP
jgi:hypothetical protein